MCIMERKCEGSEWINLARDRVRLWALVSTKIALRVDTADLFIN